MCLCDASANKFYASALDQCKLCWYFVAKCQTCVAGVTCTSCKTGYGLVGNVCQICPNNCTTCADTTLDCTACSIPSYSIVSGVCKCTETSGAT